MQSLLFETLGIAQMVSWVYIAIAQFFGSYKERNTISKVVTWFGTVTLFLFLSDKL